MRLEFVADPHGESGRCLDEELERRRAERRAGMEAGARGHPLVTRTLARLGGTLERITVPDVLDTAPSPEAP